MRCLFLTLFLSLLKWIKIKFNLFHRINANDGFVEWLFWRQPSFTRSDASMVFILGVLHWHLASNQLINLTYIFYFRSITTSLFFSLSLSILCISIRSSEAVTENGMYNDLQVFEWLHLQSINGKMRILTATCYDLKLCEKQQQYRKQIKLCSEHWNNIIISNWNWERDTHKQKNV